MCRVTIVHIMHCIYIQEPCHMAISLSNLPFSSCRNTLTFLYNFFYIKSLLFNYPVNMTNYQTVKSQSINSSLNIHLINMAAHIKFTSERRDKWQILSNNNYDDVLFIQLRAFVLKGMVYIAVVLVEKFS